MAHVARLSLRVAPTSAENEARRNLVEIQTKTFPAEPD
jgi:hypothetical protein